MTQPSSFGQWLKARRKALDLRQWDLADRIGCAEATIQKIETDQRRPSRQVAQLLADALAIPPGERAAFIAFARGQAATPEPAEPPAEPPWQTTPPALQHGAPLTRLIGRAALLAEARAAVRAGTARILTLTGPPGVGKTRLATALAAEAAGDFPNGVHFVPLAAVRDVAVVPSAIAAALGVGGTAQPLQTIQLHLREARALLILDNFEQILEGAPLLVDLLAGCPGVRALVTSRAALNVRGEQLLAVPPLPAPNPAALPPLDELALTPAVDLFVERARMLQPTFQLTPENAADVAAICAYLEGLPLALELAAARTRLLSPAALLARLGSRLALLTSGPRDLPARQQTLRDAVAWSYDLLSEGEQCLFRRLGVFVGGWTLPAAEAVCNAQGDLPMPVLDGLSVLLDHSLITLAPAGTDEPRFAMLEMIREYAHEQLVACGETAEIHALHAEYYLALVLAEETEFRGLRSAAALAHVAGEQGNIHEIFRWAIASGSLETAQRLAWTYSRCCEIRGDLSEGRYWLEALLAASPEPSAERGRLLVGAGRLAWLQGEYGVAREFAEQSVETLRAAHDTHYLPMALHGLAVQLGALGEPERAQACYEESLGLMRAAGQMGGVARILNSQGVEARARGDYAQAHRLFEESLAIHRELGNANSVGLLLANLAYTAHDQGDYARAGRLFAESLTQRRDLGHRIGMEDCLAGLAAVASRQGAFARAARLFGAAEALSESIGYTLEPDDQRWRDREVAALRAAAPPDLCARVWAEGRALPLDEAVNLALRGPLCTPDEGTIHIPADLV